MFPHSPKHWWCKASCLLFIWVEFFQHTERLFLMLLLTLITLSNSPILSHNHENIHIRVVDEDTQRSTFVNFLKLDNNLCNIWLERSLNEFHWCPDEREEILKLH